MEAKPVDMEKVHADLLEIREILLDKRDRGSNNDTSSLTTDQIRREIGTLREMLLTRLEGMEKASDVFQENLFRVPTEVDKQVGCLRELHEARFTAFENERTMLMAAIQRQFTDVDSKLRSYETVAKEALATTLAGLKESASAQNHANAVSAAKTEANTTKQIDSLASLLALNSKSFDDKITSINARLDRSEGLHSGTTLNNARQNTQNTITIAIIAAIASFLGVGATIYASSPHNQSPIIEREQNGR